MSTAHVIPHRDSDYGTVGHFSLTGYEVLSEKPTADDIPTVIREVATTPRKDIRA